MSDAMSHALTAGEWNTKTVRNVTGNVLATAEPNGKYATVRILAPGAVVEFDRAEALVPLINNALPDGHPHKITAADVAAITNLAQGYRDPDDIAAAQRAAEKLAAILRPA